MLPVKENRRALSGALDALPWGQVPIARTATDKGHGRITTRTIQVMAAPEDLPFPHVSQVFLIERHVTDLRGQPISAVAALGVASRAPDQASPADLVGYVREQWSIESLHWTRHVQRGQIQGQNPKWPQGHGCSPRRRPGVAGASKLVAPGAVVRADEPGREGNTIGVSVQSLVAGLVGAVVPKKPGEVQRGIAPHLPVTIAS